MNKNEPFKKLLLEERENLLKELIASDESAKDLIENDMHNVNDSVDEASSSVTQTMLAIMNKNNRQKIIAIEAALRRIVESSYGICISCGKEITKNRLEAVPWTTKCIKCKTNDEKKH
ncbi:MAG: TraR/DksA family transcriptional regulator [Spirochaetes bacterium]|nr:TraR/DksA family transcriptional regulator [Spirochaetota bacterium]